MNGRATMGSAAGAGLGVLAILMLGGPGAVLKPFLHAGVTAATVR